MFLCAEINLISWDREYEQMLWNFIPFKANVPSYRKQTVYYMKQINSYRQVIYNNFISGVSRAFNPF